MELVLLYKYINCTVDKLSTGTDTDHKLHYYSKIYYSKHYSHSEYQLPIQTYFSPLIMRIWGVAVSPPIGRSIAVVAEATAQ